MSAKMEVGRGEEAEAAKKEAVMEEEGERGEAA
jgi:hypothetical protein